MAEFVLIHGAWHGAWYWSRLIEELEGMGHVVRAPDLPGHGDDPADGASVTMDDYVGRVVGALMEGSEPAVLLGHSMGGMPVSAAAEAEPDRVAALVYLCAFLPRDGESLGSIERRNPRPLVPQHVTPDGGVLRIDPSRGRELFYGDASEADVAHAASRLTPQPAQPFGAPVALTEARFGRIPKHYVECTRDGAISIELQRDMAAATPGVTVHSLASDHSPFLSRPAELAATLDAIARLRPPAA